VLHQQSAIIEMRWLLPSFLPTAKQDFEFRNCQRRSRGRIIDGDWRQYEEWLKK
jgi:hypothetical protein